MKKDTVIFTMVMRELTLNEVQEVSGGVGINKGNISPSLGSWVQPTFGYGDSQPIFCPPGYVVPVSHDL